MSDRNSSFYRSISIGTLELEGNLFLAPVAGYSDRAFRSVCIELGANFTCTELISSEALIRDAKKSEYLMKRADNEKAYAIQLFGSDPEVMYQAALRLASYHPEVVDINCGCPVPKVVKTGAGSALMRDLNRLGKIVAAVVRASREALGGVPVTVKIRSGWDEKSINYREAAAIAVENGAALVALHARTRAQGYAGKAQWEHIADLASRLTVPVVGSGDLFSPEDALRMLQETGCAAVMFARGAMGNPFIFTETRALIEIGTYTPVPPKERIQTGFTQLKRLATDIGESTACKEMRKQFCAYTKGIEGGAALRNELVHAETILQFQEILSYYLS
ncbi:tRNA dihydrouridine synthase DusB [Gracilinema caldarium]|uniref:tRNA-dihydrouridine synthase n=1 Tax=Gracilinema caldarium (strain ATCC 51460 / DSM 7334 / H1) TaxID=744872 RepID=F8EWU5_GRAC1|nr:tRNA dihydrouridine synthase DusB [Gracilinema caldarium]AEJ18331.1 TIM-barrel protein, nifR3 family [Gracilinema caldarium DSM 7334]